MQNLLKSCVNRSTTAQRLWRASSSGLLIIAILGSTIFSTFFTPNVTASNLPTTTSHASTASQVTSEDKTKETKEKPSEEAEPAPTSGPPTRNLYSGNPVTFTNSSVITINDNAAASPYPSDLVVSGLPITATGMTVSLYGMYHTYPADIDILLVGPGGQKTILMSDRGTGSDIVNVNLTFDDTAAASLGTGQITSGTYKPSDNLGSSADDSLPSPAPAAPHAVTLSVFNGINPNGTWKLYVRDDSSTDSGLIAGGWAIAFYVTQPWVGSSAGNYQSTAIGTPFPVQLQAVVRNSTTNPISGVVVTFTAPISGASGTFAGNSTVYTGTTDAAGLVTATLFTANTVVGSYPVTVTAENITLSNSFTLSNLVGAAANIVPSSGSGQATVVDTAFAQPLATVVRDSYNNLVANTTVTFTAPSSGASGIFASGLTTYTGTTNATGIVTSTTFTANALAGSYVVTASVAGVSTPASFTLTNTSKSQVQFQASSYTVGEAVGTTLITLTRQTSNSSPISVTVLANPLTASNADFSLINNTTIYNSAFSTTVGFNNNVIDILVQPDGKILATGDFTTYNGTARKYITRLNADGTLDTTFDPGTSTNSRPERLALQPDGKILVVGSFSTFNGITHTNIVRLNSDGSVDNSFNPSPTTDKYITKIVTIQPA